MPAPRASVRTPRARRPSPAPALLLTRLMVRIAQHVDDLAIVDAGLAVAGRTGTLAEGGRFTGEAA
ncbi:hypothetical protein PED38_04095, partial [Clavibacter sp. CT19]|uniref:hypothetical protein n=1 Tax=Clavibacter sp. CT19 TaxID=3018990 RepID=UPI0022EA7438